LRIERNEIEVSSALTKMAPLPSDTANSGLSPSGIEPTTEPSAALMTVEFCRAVEGEDALGGRIVNDGVRIRVGFAVPMPSRV